MKHSRRGLELDSIDLKILRELQEDARITNVDLAQRVGLSPSPCLQRQRRLEAEGVIRRYEGVVDIGRLADVIHVFTQITLADHGREDFARFEAALLKEPTVLECHLVSGGFDYLCRFVARDITHYQAIIEGLLEAEIGISRYFSFIVIKSPLESRAPALETYVEASDRPRKGSRS